MYLIAIVDRISKPEDHFINNRLRLAIPSTAWFPAHLMLRPIILHQYHATGWMLCLLPLGGK
jgi:hypothetical protein